MKTRRGLSALLLAAVLSGSPLQAQNPPATEGNTNAVHRLRERIEQVPVLRGQFTQEKRVAGFRNPLRSSGQFVLDVQRGVIWDTRQPFASEVVLTPSRIATRLPDGRLRIEADARQQPELAAINATLFALMAGRIETLTQNFRIHDLSLLDRQWSVQLEPQDALLAQVFSRIDLEGGRFVEQVRLHARDGDQTLIRFAELATEPAQLSADEAARLE